MAAAIPLPMISAPTTATARPKLSMMLRTNTIGSIRKPVTTKNIGMKKALPMNSSFSFAGFF